jgi:hypothetical protein
LTIIALSVLGLLSGWAINALLRRYRHLEWVAVLLTYYGPKPTGEDGVFTRRDHLRGAGLALLAAAACAGLGLLSYNISFGWPNGAKKTMIAEVYGFILVILSLVAVAAMLQALWRALFWRPLVVVDETTGEVLFRDRDA